LRIETELLLARELLINIHVKFLQQFLLDTQVTGSCRICQISCVNALLRCKYFCWRSLAHYRQLFIARSVTSQSV